jgi:hypothetical protein
MKPESSFPYSQEPSTDLYPKLYCDGFAQSIARQRLGKHFRGNEYAPIGCPVLGNVAVTRLDNNSGNRRCFICGPCRVYITRVSL